MHHDQYLPSWLPRLRRQARALTAHRDAADDLVEQTLAQARAGLTLWRRAGDMRAWLFGIMHRLQLERIGLPDRPDWLGEAMPEAPLASRRGAVDLQAALDLLPHEQREIVLLVGLEDMAYADVATLLDIPLGTVMARLAQGREHLRRLSDRRAEPARLRRVK